MNIPVASTVTKQQGEESDNEIQQNINDTDETQPLMSRSRPNLYSNKDNTLQVHVIYLQQTLASKLKEKFRNSLLGKKVSTTYYNNTL